MRKLLSLLAVAVLCSGVSLAIGATLEEKTIKGEGQCAKCSLKETKACQNAIVVEEDGKEVTYYLEHNDVSKKFHREVCQDVKTVKATGEVKEQDGKKILVPSKIEVVEE